MCIEKGYHNTWKSKLNNGILEGIITRNDSSKLLYCNSPD